LSVPLKECEKVAVKSTPHHARWQQSRNHAELVGYWLSRKIGSAPMGTVEPEEIECEPPCRSLYVL
jgi:hypothetical protein